MLSSEGQGASSQRRTPHSKTLGVDNSMQWPAVSALSQLKWYFLTFLWSPFSLNIFFCMGSAAASARDPSCSGYINAYTTDLTLRYDSTYSKCWLLFHEKHCVSAKGFTPVSLKKKKKNTCYDRHLVAGLLVSSSLYL